MNEYGYNMGIHMQIHICNRKTPLKFTIKYFKKNKNNSMHGSCPLSHYLSTSTFLPPQSNHHTILLPTFQVRGQNLDQSQNLVSRLRIKSWYMQLWSRMGVRSYVRFRSQGKNLVFVIGVGGGGSWFDIGLWVRSRVVGGVWIITQILGQDQELNQDFVS